MSGLLDVQRRVQRALTDGADTLEDLAPDAARRLAIHRTTIEAGLALTLTNAFPTVRRVIGAQAFAMLAAAFIAARPPRHPLLSTYGAGFPAFVAAQPVAASLPYLHDVARLDWARQESYLAATAPALDAAHLDTGNADALGALALRLHPAARVITSPFPVHHIWKVNQPDVATEDIPTLDMSIAEHVIVTRPHGEVITRPISLADATFVRAAMTGATLSAAVEAAFAVSHDFDVKTALAGHFANGTFQAF